MRYRFGDYEVDASRFLLLRKGAEVRIEPRPLALLLLLLERHPHVVPRDELLRALWPDTVVLEGSLTRAVREIRRALRERADGDSIIRTVRGKGYGITVDVVTQAEEDQGEGHGRATVRGSPAGDETTAALPAHGGPARRLLAILSADLVDFSGHQAWDAARTEARLDALREDLGGLVRDHGGMLVNFVADNVLAVFQSAERAARVAQALLDRNRREAAAATGAPPLVFRVGLHLAELIEDGGRVYGGGVDVASRIERLAKPGAICLSGAVRDQLGDRLGVAFEDRGDQVLKGIPEPLRIFQIAPETGVGP